MVHRAIANMMNSLTKSQGSPALLGWAVLQMTGRVSRVNVGPKA